MRLRGVIRVAALLIVASSVEVAGQSLPPGWNTNDIGNPALAGQAAYSGGVFTLEGAGADIWNSRDEFFFAHQAITGDVDVVARVASVEHVDNWTKAGVMIRGALTADAAHAFMLVSPGKGLAFQRRATPGGTSVHTSGGAGTAPAWVKLERRGNVVTAFRSQDGTAWTMVGAQTLTLPGAAYVGLAVTSHDDGALATGRFDSVTVTPAAATAAPAVTLTAPEEDASFAAPATITLTADASHPDDGVAQVEFFAGAVLIGTDSSSPYSVTWSDVPPGTYSLTAVARDEAGRTTTSASRTVTVSGQAPAPGLPSDWAAADVGSPALAGSASASGGVFTVRGAGVDLWDRRDEFMYVHQVAGGDVDIVARVASFDATHYFAKAGVMIRESLAPNAAHVSLFVTPGRGFRFHVRPATDALSSSTTAEGAAPAWVKLARRDATITASYSFDGATWTEIGSQVLTLPATFYVGLAVGSVNAQELATGTFDDVAVTRPAGDSTPPTVSLTAPADGATVAGVVAIDAAAADDSGVRDVTFRVDGAVIDTVTASPYTTAWDTAGAAAGAHVLTAEAADTSGNRTTSAPITVYIAAPNQAPTVSLTAPPDGASFTAPATITVTVDAADPDGTVAQVEFFAGQVLIGTDSSSPYSVTWSDVAAGTYTLTAAARDQDGLTTTSSARTVTVTDPPPPDTTPPTVVLTAPAHGAEVQGIVTLTATASDNDAVTEVVFRVDGTDVGQDAVAPYSASWDTSSAAAGTHVLTAVARDAAGNTATSSGITVMVAAGLPSDWAAADVGSPALAGSASASGDVFTVRGAGVDLWDRHDEFMFVHQVAGGDVDIVARVASFDATHPFAKAGVMIRESLASNAGHVSLFVTPERGFRFHFRPATDALSSSETADGVAPAWVKLTRRGTTITGYYSLDGTTWTAIGTQTLTLSASYYVGLAVGSVDPEELATATFDEVVVSTPAPDTTPPAATLTAPADGATFTAPATITIAADASDADGVLARVDFFAGTMLVGSDDTAPYSVVWRDVPAGSYALTAVAHNGAGATSTSEARGIVVGDPEPPGQAIFVPSSNHDTAVERYVLDIYTAGADPDTASPVHTQNLGKPAVVGGECTVDVSQTILSLPSGVYIATVTAFGPGGTARSTPSPTFTR